MLPGKTSEGQVRVGAWPAFSSGLLTAWGRLFARILLPPDRYGARFFLTLGAVLAFIGLCYWSVRVYWAVRWFSHEDGLTEWGTVAMYLGSAGLAFATGRGLARLGYPRLGWVHWLLAAALLVASLEEISWGQRLLGWSTPGPLSGVNFQDETNLHNVELFDRLFYTTLLWGSLLALAGGAVRAFLHGRGRVTTADFILPSLVLSPALLLIALWSGEGRFFEVVQEAFPSRPVGSEFPELLLGFALLVYTYGNVRRARALRSLQATGQGG